LVPMSLGDLDLHLIGEGRHRRLWEVLGAHCLPLAGVRFAVWAPNARSVGVAGDWNGWDAGDTPLYPVGVSGVWMGADDRAAAGQCYKFAVQGVDGVTRLKADPVARRTERPPANASIIEGVSTYRWGDAAWMEQRTNLARANNPLRIYEVHLGSWQAGRGYAELGPLLADHAQHLGFTHVELLPVAEHPFGGSWGYQVSGYFSPTARFGTPDEFREMVDALHRRGLGVNVDGVPAHFPKDDWSLARFDGTALYEHDDPRRGEHPDWGTHVFNYGRHEVRNFLVANALYWLDEFHIDGLRVDAVASMLYLDYSRAHGDWVPNRDGGREHLEAIEFIREVNSLCSELHPGALMIAEESTAWAGVTQSADRNGLGFSHKWNMGWMHDTLQYFGREAVHRKWHHHGLTFGLMYAWSERFVLPLSHDEVVHGKGSLLGKMTGDEWQRFANLRALYAWMWAHPGAPLLFMGSELAPYAEWSADTSLPWDLLQWDSHRGVFDLVRELNRLADAYPAIWERDHEPTGFEWLDADNAEASVYAFLRWGERGQRAVVCLVNLTPVSRPGYRAGVPWSGNWEVVLDTDDPVWGGSGARRSKATTVPATGVPYQGQPDSIVVDLPPLSGIWLAAGR
ncbi:MAG: 1,4-alpha-glucan branching protein GlgB, partial [Ilumatobacteraceae bacterium]